VLHSKQFHRELASQAQRFEKAFESSWDCICKEDKYPLCILKKVCLNENDIFYHSSQNITFPLHTMEGCAVRNLRNAYYHPTYLPENPTFAPGLHLIRQNWPYGDNFGHVLGDEIWPIFQGMELFERERGIILLWPGFPRRHAQHTLKMYDLLPHLKLREMYVEEEGSEWEDMCVEELMIGWGKLGYEVASMEDYCEGKADQFHKSAVEFRPKCFGSFRRMMLKFRDYSYTRYDLKSKHMDTITFINKNDTGALHQYIWGNLEDVVSRVRSEFRDFRVRVVSWSGMPLKEQVRTVYESKVLISLPGSDVMNAVWLQDDAALIIVCRSEIDPHGEDYRIWFRYFDWITSKFFLRSFSKRSFSMQKIAEPLVLNMEKNAQFNTQVW